MSDEAHVRHLAGAEPGDWLEVDRIGGGPSRRGQILEVVGSGAIPHFHVRWTDESETIHYPADGDRLVKAR